MPGPVSRADGAPEELGLQDRKGGATADPRRSLSDQFGAELPVEAFSGRVRDDLHHSATLLPRSFRTLLEQGPSDPTSLYRGQNPEVLENGKDGVALPDCREADDPPVEVCLKAHTVAEVLLVDPQQRDGSFQVSFIVVPAPFRSFDHGIDLLHVPARGGEDFKAAPAFGVPNPHHCPRATRIIDQSTPRITPRRSPAAPERRRP